MSYRGKEIAGKDTGGKRKRVADKTGGRGKKRNRGVVQFFEDAAYEVGDDDDDDVSDLSGFSDWDFFENECEAQPSKVINEPGKAHNVPVFPKEEELSEEDLERMLKERYKPGSSYVTYAEDNIYNSKRAVDVNEEMPSYKESIIWKVKCMVGREKQSVFCLMQKYVELNSLGNKLQIISAFSIEHVKGFIYIEAERQSDINEACKGLCTLYSSRVAPVPKNEVSNMLSVRSKSNEVSVGSWARVKNGTYKGDLAQVIFVNDSRKKATVKLLPRIDFQKLAEKYGGGVAKRKTAIPAPRLISSSELEEFRPLIQYRRDRESGLAFEVLDGMMFKDGYIYKKISIDSLSLWGVMPTEDELSKFEFSKNEEPDCQEWLNELYGEKKKERAVKSDKSGGKGGGKGEGSSSSGVESCFEVNDLVFFNRKDFGVVVGLEKEEYYKILKEGSKGPLVITMDMRQLKKASFESKFTALDKHKRTISINDTVRVTEGPLEGRQGNVKHIYRGIIFLHDEIEQENNGYFCCKSQICEKIKFSGDASKGKDGDSSFPAFDDLPSSPKSPLSPEKKTWENKERNTSFNREDKEGMFTVGQSLRIRVGPLKGYLCRVLAIRRTDVTVKLDSQHKILTVKSEHLAEVRGRSSAIPMSDDKEAKPFDLLGDPDGSTDWMTGAGTSADGERSSWPAFPSSGASGQPESNFAVDMDSKKDEDGGGWGSKLTPKLSSTWGNAMADENPVASNEQTGGWGSGGGNWGKPKPTEEQAEPSQDAGGWGSGGGNWGKPKPTEDQTGPLQDAGGWGRGGGNWGKPKSSTEDQGGSSQYIGGNWGSKPKAGSLNDVGATWGKKDNASTESHLDSWGKGSNGGSGESNWGKSVKSADKGFDNGDGSGSSKDWGDSVANPKTQTTAWGKAASDDGGQGADGDKIDSERDANASVWGQISNAKEDQYGSWGQTNRKDTQAWGKSSKADGGQAGSWDKTNMKKDVSVSARGKTVESADATPDKVAEDDSWGKAANSWGKKDDSSGKKAAWNSANPAQENQGGGWGSNGGSSWNNKKDTGGSSWGGSSWGKAADSEDKGKPDWGEQDNGSSWGKQGGGGGGSSWGRQNDGNTEGYGGWNKDGGGDQQDSIDGGRGGGRRGRDGWRGGGRGGRSFGEDDQENSRVGGDRGGYRGGRGGGWSDRGGRGGDRGGFRGRGRSDRGGGRFGGRGRENSDWDSNQNDGGSGWKSGNSGGGGGWGGSSGGGGGWGGSGGGAGGGWSKGNGFGDGGSSGNQSSGWGVATGSKEASQRSGWNKETSFKDGGFSGNKPCLLADGGRPSILGTPKDSTTGDSPGFVWGKMGNSSGDGSSSGTWNKPGPVNGNGGQSSGWGAAPEKATEGSAGGQWGNSAGGSSWGKGNNNGGNEGGW